MYRLTKVMAAAVKRAQDLMTERERINTALAAATEELPILTAAIEEAKSAVGRAELAALDGADNTPAAAREALRNACERVEQTRLRISALDYRSQNWTASFRTSEQSSLQP